VLDYIGQGEMRSRAQILARFSHDDHNLVRGVLHDLTENGLVFSAGSGGDQVYRGTTRAEQLQMGRLADAAGLQELLWAFIYREGPVTRAELGEFAASNPSQIDAALAQLVALGKVTASGEGDVRSYRAERLEVLLEAAAGWEAAVFDHFRAMVQTICQRLTTARNGDAAQRVGGSTFTLDVWEGHPLAQEAYGVLARFRSEHAALFERVEQHNAEHARPDDYDQVVIYAGQHVLPRRRSDDEVVS
jgi:hypothetical protein